MADPEESSSKPSRHRRDRTERSHRRRMADNRDTTTGNFDLNSSNLGDSGEANEQFLSPESAEREVSPRIKEKRRSKSKDEPEANACEEAPTESAAGGGESPGRTRIKKEKKSENSARKRREKKNLREKRRSTGVVIMPTGESDEEENEEHKALKAHTQQNELLVSNDDPVDILIRLGVKRSVYQTILKGKHLLMNKYYANAKGIPNIRIDDKVLNDSDTITQQKLKEKVEEYELQIEDFKSQLERANKELEHLRLDNQRLKDENSALLRVVNQLSTKKK